MVDAMYDLSSTKETRLSFYRQYYLKWGELTHSCWACGSSPTKRWFNFTMWGAVAGSDKVGWS